MRTALANPVKLLNIHFSAIENLPGNRIHKNATAKLEVGNKHYLLHNLDILLKVSKQEKQLSNLETAASIIREYEFLSLVNDMKKENL